MNALDPEVHQLIEEARLLAAAKLQAPRDESAGALGSGLVEFEHGSPQARLEDVLGGLQSEGVPLEPVSSSLEGPPWKQRFEEASDFPQLGALLAAGWANGYVPNGFEFLLKNAKPIATSVATSSKELFPLPVDLSFFSGRSLPPGDFEHTECVQAWVLLVAAALNVLHGCRMPFPTERRNRAAKRSLSVLGDRVSRFLIQPVHVPPSRQDVWAELLGKGVSYEGEEIALAQPLTLAQIEPTLPPVGYGGSVELAPLLRGQARFLVEHPELLVLDPSLKSSPKNVAKVHIEKGQEVPIFKLLYERGIIDFVDERDVFADHAGKFLSGLFGVPKPGKVCALGTPILRLIMNLIPVNGAMMEIAADVSTLPAATSWQQLVLLEQDSISISQADMSSAFYLFKMPPQWPQFFCFQVALSRESLGIPGTGIVYPGCRVLPMGWSSSVGLMQMASRRLMELAQLNPAHELRRGVCVPEWFCDPRPDQREHHLWWQIYLDNFMCAEVSRQGAASGVDQQLHAQAVDAWNSAGVLCSVDKHVLGASVATELGVEINGETGAVGASASRLFKTVLSTLMLLKQRRGKLKHCQIVLGRWIFALQFCRPAMSGLSNAWDYINKAARRDLSWRVLCKELAVIVVMTPLLQANARMGDSGLVTCSDASESGGAVAASQQLTVAGKGMATLLTQPTLKPVDVDIVVISAFNGIGGAFRAYDLCGVRPIHLISVEIDRAAQRTVKLLWPRALHIGDVNSITEEMVRGWANTFGTAVECHLWGGFPCVHLSSARFGRLNLQGQGSNLFFVLVQLIEWCQRHFACPTHFVVENVASMDGDARDEISAHLQVKPLRLDPAGYRGPG